LLIVTFDVSNPQSTVLNQQRINNQRSKINNGVPREDH